MIDPIIQQIDEHRRKTGMTQADIADAIGTSRPTVALYLSGRKVPGLAVLRRLCEAVGLDLRVVRRR